MIPQHSPPHAKRYHGRRNVPVEPLSARLFRLRIARGFSIYELAATADVLACTVQRLESGKPIDKRVLPALAKALAVPLCQLVCGEHICTERACILAAGVRRQYADG